MVMGLPVVISAVSEPVRAILSSEFGRGKALLLPNGIDTSGPAGFWPLSDAVQGIGQDAVQGTGLDPSRESIPDHHPPVTASTEPRPRVAGDQHGLSDPWVEAGLPPPTQTIGKAEVINEEICFEGMLMTLYTWCLTSFGYFPHLKVLQR